MTTPGLAGSGPTTRFTVQPLTPDPPAWVHDLFGGGQPEMPGDAIAGLTIATREPFVLLRARIPDAARLAADALSGAVEDRYRAIHLALSALHKQPIRFWNYVPGIVDAVDGGIDRYMAFNCGRHRAYAALTPAGAETRAAATASAVGVESPDLVIDCLASTDGGRPVENPRQIASWRYSNRYGPRPPCFARGVCTSFDQHRVLLLGGTASIVGEESRHVGDVAAQVDELLRNMAMLIAEAGVAERAALTALTDARIYVVDELDAGLIESAIHDRAGTHVRLQTARSRICRRELLVEVEGVASLGSGAS